MFKTAGNFGCTVVCGIIFVNSPRQMIRAASRYLAAILPVLYGLLKCGEFTKLIPHTTVYVVS
jgi:hypothetical protein